MDYESKRLRITLWTVVALLIFSIVGVCILFAVKMHPDTPTPNVVNVGARISRGKGFKSTSTNANIWDGTSTTDWTGSGTEADPYLITKGSQLAGLGERASDYANMFFKLANDIDMCGDSYGFMPIVDFRGTFNGDNHCLTNLQFSPFWNVESGLFYNLNDSTISNLIIEVIFALNPASSFGGLAYSVENSTVSNVNISFLNALTTEYSAYADGMKFAGLVNEARSSTIENCTVNNFTIEAKMDQSGALTNLGGLVAEAYDSTITSCNAESYINIEFTKATTNTALYSAIGGLIGYEEGNNRIYTNNISCGKIIVTDIKTSHTAYIGGMLGLSGSKNGDALKMCNNLSQCDIEITSRNTNILVAGLGNNIHNNISSKYNIVNATIKASSKLKSAGGVDSSALSTSKVVYNKNKYSVSGASKNNTVGATSDANMKLRSTYSSWTDFDTYWVIDEKYNNGYPYLKALIPVANVTLFEGKGTETEPYLISTQQDLLNINEYYADTENAKADMYFKLMNDIDVSKDLNNLPIHFKPICYNREFDGYFDGNGKTISGLLIDHQYEYAGLFGTVAANHWVKNLTVKGNIYWDQAYAVGGVAGRVMAGGYLQNCSFNGDIIGVLNTKSSTECNGVVGKYELNGAVDCTATYTDLKYAKIGGTTDAPTYTYYLYDWAQLTTSLYNKKVS